MAILLEDGKEVDKNTDWHEIQKDEVLAVCGICGDDRVMSKPVCKCSTIEIIN